MREKKKGIGLMKVGPFLSKISGGCVIGTNTRHNFMSTSMESYHHQVSLRIDTFFYLLLEDFRKEFQCLFSK